MFKRKGGCWQSKEKLLKMLIKLFKEITKLELIRRGMINCLLKQALKKNPSAFFVRKRGMLRRTVRTLLHRLKRKVHLLATPPH